MFNFLIIIIILYFIWYFFNKMCNKENFKNNTDIVIVGTAKNIEMHIPNVIEKLEMIADIFRNSKIIIYENDSLDDTLKLLNNWKDKSPFDIEIISEKNIEGKRTHVLSNARNLLLKKALELQTEYLLVIDLDDSIYDLTQQSILSNFKHNDIDWACLGANQEYEYYDVWALRTFDDWLPFDWVECRDEEKKDISYCLYSRYRKIEKTPNLIEVKSCFGGTAIYKTKYLKNCSYYGGTGQKEVCEHVKFNECIRKNGGRIYINPEFIN